MPDQPASLQDHHTREAPRPFVIVTGLSGAGRVTALHALDDMGYVAVDNIPLPLLSDFVRSTAAGSGEMAVPMAFGIDTRTYGFDPHDLVRRLEELRGRSDLAARLLFLDCDDDTLQRRYTESRRPHPQAPDRPLLDAVADERRQIGWMRDSADVVIDTSMLSPHQLKQLLAGHFALGRDLATRVSVMSFSYRRGLPREADLVFDVRFLKNPHYVPALKPLTGRDPDVAAYVATDPGYRPFLASLKALIEPLLPRFDAEGKSYLTIAVGCTGGRHRSVAVAEELAGWLRGLGRSVTLSHRDAAAAGEAGSVGAGS
ncbi:MAG: RNase adapter RapZ [Reyranellaceae bacterium]